MNYLARNVESRVTVGFWMLLNSMQVTDVALTQFAVTNHLATEANPLFHHATEQGQWEALWIIKLLMILAMVFPLFMKRANWYYIPCALFMTANNIRSIYIIVLAWKAGLIQ